MIKRFLANSYLLVFIIASLIILKKTEFALPNLIICGIGIVLLALFSLIGNNTKHITNMIKSEMNSNDFEYLSNSYKGTFKIICWFISLGLLILQIILIV